MTDKVIKDRISTILDLLTIADEKTTDELMIMLIEYAMTNEYQSTEKSLAAELLMLLITADQDKCNVLDSYE